MPPATAPPKRVSGWILAAGAAAVLAVGTWWWFAAAPAPAPLPSPPSVGGVEGAGLADGPGVLWHTTQRLPDGSAMSWDGLVAGQSYVLRFVCWGDGDLRIGVGTRGWSNEERYPCSQELSVVPFSAGAGGALRVSRLGSPVTVTVQLTAG